MVGKVDAHGLGGDLIVADGLERAAVGGVDKQDDERDAECRKQHRSQHAVKLRELFENVGGVRYGAENVPLDYPRRISAKPSVAIAR